MKKPVFQQIAEDLEHRILGSRRFVLPTLAEYARQTGAGYCSVWKAYQVLIEKGVLVQRLGRKTAIAPTLRKGEPAADGSFAERLCEKLRKRVVDGEYPAGERFPKIGYFVVTEGVSHPVVSKAFARLADEGLAYKERRRWVVGPRRGRGSGRFSSGASTVLLRVDATAGWHVNLMEPYTNAFLAPFLGQLVKHNHKLSMVAQGHDLPAEPTIPIGLDQVCAAASSLREGYRGILLKTVFPELSQLDEWITRLRRLGEPVVYLDVADVGGYLTREALSIKGGYFRLHTDERAAVQVAVEALARTGHRRVGIHGHELFEWGERRTRLIEEMAGRMDPPMRIALAGESESHWNFANLSGLYDFVGAISQKLSDERTGARVHSETFRRALIQESPSLVSLLRDESPTALIALNDQMASEYYHWCRLARIRVPEDLSIVSFDNLLQSIIFPVSTVDFGPARLGHLAAHILIGDLPITADRHGHIAGECTLVDRGSVGKPGDPRRLRRLLSA